MIPAFQSSKATNVNRNTCNRFCLYPAFCLIQQRGITYSADKETTQELSEILIETTADLFQTINESAAKKAKNAIFMQTTRPHHRNY